MDEVVLFLQSFICSFPPQYLPQLISLILIVDGHPPLHHMFIITKFEVIVLKLTFYDTAALFFFLVCGQEKQLER